MPEPETPSLFLRALILLFVGSIGGGILVGELILFGGRERVPVTPILAISENSTYWDTPEGGFILYWNFGLIFGSLIRSFARKSKFLLSEEGVVFYRITGPTVVRWEKIKAYKADPANKLFHLKRNVGNWLPLVCTQHFDEANKILSNRVKMAST
nr:hypothetical protein [Candidatus Njordarchaeum guaymaensis]